MTVDVRARLSRGDGGYDFVLEQTSGPPSDLTQDVGFGAGVELTFDLARPTSWHRVTVVNWSAMSEPLVRILAGPGAIRALRAAADDPDDARLYRSVAVPTTSSFMEPWLRVAAIHGLDRWLHVPIDQALLQAELAVATLRAADTLPTGAEVRRIVLDDALDWARRASTGMTRYLRAIPGRRAPIPAALGRSLQDVVEGYTALRSFVPGPDPHLDGVLESWPTAADHDRANQSAGVSDLVTSPASSAQRGRSRLASLIDPRYVRARVLRLGDHAAIGEITLTRTLNAHGEAIRIRVPAFTRLVDPEIAQRLMARLVHRRSGEAVSFAPLTIPDHPRAPSRPPVFQTTMPLFGARLEDVRADVFDALDHSRLADGGGDDRDLLRVREAVLMLQRRRRDQAETWLTEPREPSTARGPAQPLLAELAALHLDRAA